MASMKKSGPTTVTGIKRNIDKAIGQLSAFLLDEHTRVEVARLLDELGTFAIKPLAAALPRTESREVRGAIIGALMGLGARDPVLAMLALEPFAKSETDPELKAKFGWVMFQLGVDALKADSERAAAKRAAT